MDNNQKIFNDIISNSKGKLDKETISKAAKSGDASALVNNLSKEDKQKLNNILSDKQALSEILKSPQAKALMKMFGKGNNNG